MSMFSLVFMRNAYLAGTFIAIICGTIGVFVIAEPLISDTHTVWNWVCQCSLRDFYGLDRVEWDADFYRD